MRAVNTRTGRSAGVLREELRGDSRLGEHATRRRAQVGVIRMKCERAHDGVQKLLLVYAESLGAVGTSRERRQQLHCIMRDIAISPMSHKRIERDRRAARLGDSARRLRVNFAALARAWLAIVTRTAARFLNTPEKCRQRRTLRRRVVGTRTHRRDHFSERTIRCESL